MIGLAMFGAAGAGGGGAAGDPASLNLDGYWEAPFTASPWVAKASAGASGANGDLTEATNPPTASGGDALFNGTDQLLTAANNADTYLDVASGTIFALVEILSTVPDGGAGLSLFNPWIVGTGGAPYAYMSVSDDGLRCAVNNGAYREPPAVAIPAGLHLLVMRWNGTLIEQGIDGAPTESDTGSPATLAYPLIVGTSYLSTFCNMKLRMLALSKQVFDDATCAGVAAFYGV